MAQTPRWPVHAGLSPPPCPCLTSAQEAVQGLLGESPPRPFLSLSPPSAPDRTGWWMRHQPWVPLPSSIRRAQSTATLVFPTTDDPRVCACLLPSSMEALESQDPHQCWISRTFQSTHSSHPFAAQEHLLTCPEHSTTLRSSLLLLSLGNLENREVKLLCQGHTAGPGEWFPGSTELEARGTPSLD